MFPRALDGAFLDLDAHGAPLHVGWTIRLDGPAPSLGGLRRHLAARLDRVPQLRRRLVATTLAAGARRWEDDPAFDIAHHVGAFALPAPGGQGELRAAAGVLLSAPLDPTRPLWRMCIVDGLAGGGWALVGQMHHALVDGIAAVEVAALLLDAEPDPIPRSAVVLASAADGSRARGAAGGPVAAGLRGRRGARPRHGRSARDRRRRCAICCDPPRAPRWIAGRAGGASSPIADAGLDAVREAGRTEDATVNDVLLAATSVALGAALRRRGEAHDDLKALVPVSVREAPSELGNRLSFFVVSLPVAERDPAAALGVIAARTARAKNAGHATPVAGLTESLALLPRRGRAFAARAALRLAAFDVIVSNVPGPQVPLYLMGRRVAAVHPAVPVPDGHGITIGAISYAGRVGIGLMADAAVVPDVVEIARDLEAALDGLRVTRSGASTLGAPT